MALLSAAEARVAADGAAVVNGTAAAARAPLSAPLPLALRSAAPAGSAGRPSCAPLRPMDDDRRISMHFRRRVCARSLPMCTLNVGGSAGAAAAVSAPP